MIIKPFHAFNGDCILISFADNDKTVNILLDGGIPRTYNRELKNLVDDLKVKGQVIDLLIVTHIDDDHIGGIKAMFSDADFDRSIIKKAWFNSGKILSKHFNTQEDPARDVQIVMSDTTDMSVRQGITLERALADTEGWLQELVFAGYKDNVYGAKIHVLSPSEQGLDKLNKRWETESENLNMSGDVHDDFEFAISTLANRAFNEDKAVPNGSSIAFLLEQNGKHYLFLGDAHPSVVEAELRLLGYNECHKLKASFVKIAHHASKFNTSPGLLAIIESPNFFISTDGLKHGLPNKEPLARIIMTNPGTTLHFNYRGIADKIFLAGEKEKHCFYVRSELGKDYNFEN